MLLCGKFPPCQSWVCTRLPGHCPANLAEAWASLQARTPPLQLSDVGPVWPLSPGPSLLDSSMTASQAQVRLLLSWWAQGLAPAKDHGMAAGGSHSHLCICRHFPNAHLEHRHQGPWMRAGPHSLCQSRSVSTDDPCSARGCALGRRTLAVLALLPPPRCILSADPVVLSVHRTCSTSTSVLRSERRAHQRSLARGPPAGQLVSRCCGALAHDLVFPRKECPSYEGTGSVMGTASEMTERSPEGRGHSVYGHQTQSYYNIPSECLKYTTSNTAVTRDSGVIPPTVCAFSVSVL